MKVFKIAKAYKKQKNAAFVAVKEKDLFKTLEKLKEAGGCRISTITGIDTGKDIEVIYHFDVLGKIINIKFTTSRNNAKVMTISSIFPGAKLFERELSEMLGIEVEGNAEPELLFLSEDTPKAPLRKRDKGI